MKTCQLDFGLGYRVYFLWRKNRIVYVGSTKDLQQRVRAHRQRGVLFDRVTFVRRKSRLAALTMERAMLRQHRPPQNGWHYVVGERARYNASRVTKRVNISIEGALHVLAREQARRLRLRDGFSGYVARLLKLDMKRNRKRVANETRLLGS